MFVGHSEKWQAFKLASCVLRVRSLISKKACHPAPAQGSRRSEGSLFDPSVLPPAPTNPPVRLIRGAIRNPPVLHFEPKSVHIKPQRSLHVRHSEKRHRLPDISAHTRHIRHTSPHLTKQRPRTIPREHQLHESPYWQVIGTRHRERSQGSLFDPRAHRTRVTINAASSPPQELLFPFPQNFLKSQANR